MAALPLPATIRRSLGWISAKRGLQDRLGRHGFLYEQQRLTSSNKSSFVTLVKSCKRYAVDSDNSQDYFSTFDAKDFLTKLKASSTFCTGSMSTKITACTTAFANLVKYSAWALALATPTASACSSPSRATPRAMAPSTIRTTPTSAIGFRSSTLTARSDSLLQRVSLRRDPLNCLFPFAKLPFGA
jgi:hypothetical protein